MKESLGKLAGINLENEVKYQVPFVNSTLLPLLLLSLTSQKHSPETKTKFDEEYDYIVVGGGVAGSVVASRLSEVLDVTVLLLEAGGVPPLLTDIPGASKTFISSGLGWGYRTVPQKYIGGNVKHRTLPIASGKVLGGGSAINGMVYVRGNKQNFDDWAWNGAFGWSYREVLPYFKKMEDNKNTEFLKNGTTLGIVTCLLSTYARMGKLRVQGFHGTGGPLTVETPQYHSKVSIAAKEAALSLGYEFVDINGPKQTGFYEYQSTIREGQRCSTAKAYLVPAENRANLDIITNAMATKIVIEQKRAVSVLFEIEGCRHEVRARKEIILSAGALKTPQLLMLSGIGPMAELKKFNIPVVADLPVGLNLQSHVITFMGYEVDESIKNFEEEIKEEKNILDYIYNRTGPLTLPEGFYLLAFLNTRKTSPAFDQPQVTLYIADFFTAVPVDDLDFSQEVVKNYFDPYRKKNTVACVVSNLNTKSIGTITLKSKDPRQEPLIDPNMLANFRDVQDLVEGMKLCRNLMSTPAMRNIGAKPFENLVPGCEEYEDDDELYLRCYVRNIVMEGAHLVGTAKMGSDQDPTAVVDAELRVKTIEGLRVVDASVMPSVPWGNTYIPTVMIAEKASDMIKRDLSTK
ncbi:glucose dehydrogenase [FAD, quinone]-like [Uloborus diversus]|uniref:glucose dehydrogenase [FAD, quinone]-like n=1 Tax=Uloborus diversus TaxID=327109 RepID=UPI002409236E|nr:glucose dehydrogenase [FAD, quinone]-like [Uloborus diversus]